MACRAAGLARLLPPGPGTLSGAPIMARNSVNQPVRMRLALVLCATLLLPGCAAHYAQVPARLDLHPYGRVALISFASDNPNSSLTTLATQQFAEALLASQPGIELLELGVADSALGDLATGADSAALARALGRNRTAPAVFVGHLTVSGVKPRGGIVGAAAGVNLNASVSAQLTVRLLSTQSGATMWRSSAAASRTVGHVTVSGRLPSVSARDPNAAYSEVVRELVTGVTRDLRPTLVKR